MHGTEAPSPWVRALVAPGAAPAARCWTWPAAAAATCAGSRRAAIRSPAWTATPRRSPPWRRSGETAAGRHRERPLALRRPHVRRRGRHQLPVAAAAARHRAQRRARRRADLRNLRRGQRDRRQAVAARLPAAARRTAARPARGLRVVAYEDGFLDAPARFVQRIAAVREPRPARPARRATGSRPLESPVSPSKNPT